MSRIKNFIKSQPVLTAAFAAALVTAFFVPPDKAYLGYCNTQVLILLFCLMLTVAGFRSAGVFEHISAALLKRAGNLRRLGLIMTSVCFFFAMLVTNDVALLTFVPLTLLIYEGIPDEKSRIYTIVLETAAANLGSMATPIGNPQNLYIYSEYGLTMGDFFRTMLPLTAASLLALMLLCLLLPKRPCAARPVENEKMPGALLGIYSAMFVLCLLTVLRIVPDWFCLIITVCGVLATDRRLLLKADYGLLATFVCFFVFVGNIARVEAIGEFFRSVMQGRELLISAALSQVISNVPAAVMLSGFTENSAPLLLGVNLGGLGTMIASLASLISFQFYRTSPGARTGRYMMIFSLVNFGLLAVLLALAVVLEPVFTR
ncbi:MAG: citrate transporter [Ruminococcus sp.]|nr:citrate transporter [Ruminococcus sp.]